MDIVDIAVAIGVLILCVEMVACLILVGIDLHNDRKK